MLSNTTALMPQTTEPTNVPSDTDGIYLIAFLAFRYGLLPFASVFGIAGNMISIVILSRKGFMHCSNILLLSLAVSDILLLIGMSNIPCYIYLKHEGFRFSETVNCICYILYCVFVCAFHVGTLSAEVIPVLITGERIMAIFYPFHAYLILVPRRVTILVTCLYVVSGMYFLYFDMLCFQFKQVVVKGVTVGQILYTDMYAYHVKRGLYQLIGQIINSAAGIVPIGLVTVGCLLIGLKIMQVTSRRQLLTSCQVKATTKHGATKTTRTLLSICALYIFCYGFVVAVSFILDTILLEQNLVVRNMITCVQDFVLCINCIGDFLIYAGANNIFRKSTLRQGIPNNCVSSKLMSV